MEDVAASIHIAKVGLGPEVDMVAKGGKRKFVASANAPQRLPKAAIRPMNAKTVVNSGSEPKLPV